MAPTPTPTATPTATPTPPAKTTTTPTPTPKATPTPTPATKPQYESTITPAGGGNLNAGTDPDVDTKKRERLWDVLTGKRPGLPQISDDNQKKISFFSRNVLNDLSCVANKTGTLTVFNPDGGKPIFDMAPGGAVGIRKNWDLNDKTQLTSADHIDALLKGSAVAKMSMGDAGASLSSPSDASRAMMEKAAQLSHLKIDNPKYDTPEKLEAALAAIDPALSAKMTAQWKGMKDKYEPESFTPAPIKQPVATPTPTPGATTPTPTPGATTPTATPGATAPKTAMAVTADNIKTLETSGKPVVLMVYDANNPASQAKIDALAAAAGPGVVIAKMSHDDVHALEANLKQDDPLRKALDQDNTAIAIGGDGKIIKAQVATPDNMQDWSKAALGAASFPTPTPVTPTPTPTAPPPSLSSPDR